MIHHILNVLWAIGFAYILWEHRKEINNYRTLLRLKDESLERYKDSLARTDKIVAVDKKIIDILLKQIISLNPDDDYAKEMLIRNRQLRERFVDEWEEKADERLNNGVQ